MLAPVRSLEFRSPYTGDEAKPESGKQHPVDHVQRDCVHDVHGLQRPVHVHRHQRRMASGASTVLHLRWCWDVAGILDRVPGTDQTPVE